MNYLMGQGSILIAERNAAGVASMYRRLGNCNQLQITLGTAALRHSDKNADMHESGSQPSFSILLEAFSSENLALLLRGTQRQSAAGSASDDIRVARGVIALLSNPRVAAVTGVTLVSTGAPLRAGIDYILDAGTGSVEIPVNSAVPDGSTLRVAYTRAAYTEVAAFSQISTEYSLRFNGVNMVDQAPVVLDVFRITFDPVDVVSLIGDNLSTLQVTGRVIRDESPARGFTDNRYLRFIT